ncbi:alpha/beta hydrolase [Algoriphagus sp. D3-2-R+10]|uniref:alpha/beta hydrolase n=1 Tax=Algoriphagus aurantiacus TaxID=3103948 RepID=UPI002B3E4D52|nr:alpha/beta hydrolase [Algoriphagus sp. D3-2-R+10]MEB2776457.1 alpha/beta hydrolase [Algoriphagus sp. D3-2-R+10]
MKIYGISGLGADKRVFENLTLNAQFIALDWIEPYIDESIELYALRLSGKIDENEEFGVLGVSFGGLVAVEISKYLNPVVTILISSAETYKDLRPIFKTIGQTGVIKLLPTRFFNPPRRLTSYLFGAKNRTLLYEILNDTNLSFTKWAINELLNWNNEERLNSVLKIEGARDKLIPPAKNENSIVVESGEHFMIVDKAVEISRIINGELDLI